MGCFVIKECFINCKIYLSKKELKIYFKNGPLVDGWIEWRGKPKNIPFSPWVLHIYDKKTWTDDEIYKDICRKYQEFYK